MPQHLSVDLETYSSVDLKKCGMHKYTQSPDFQIMLFAYAWDDGPVQIVDLWKETLPAEIVQALADFTIIKHAYNAAFEFTCLSKYLYTPLSSWRCTMAQGSYCGMPMGLGNIGEAIGIRQDRAKMGIGSSLIKTFCCPVKPTRTNGNRTRTLPQHEPEKWELFKSYCKRDVEAEREVARRLATWSLPEEEQSLWELDVMMNAYGVAVDPVLVEGALKCSAATTESLMSEAIRLSGLDNPNSRNQLKKWLEEELDEELDDLNKGTVKDLLKTTEDNAVVHRMLEIRLELAKTSNKKYEAMANSIGAGNRIRGLLQYYGANRTGRYAGRLVQVQNLPQNHIDELDLARSIARTGNVDLLRLAFGTVPDTLSQLIRTAFVPAEGCEFLVADFSAIEARVIAWLAGEQWVMDVFATHGKIYEATASQMFGVDISLIKKGNEEYSLRQKGKVATLALGYQGGKNALIKMGALKQGLAEEELPDIVKRWRNANKRICELWYRIDDASMTCVRTGLAQMLPHGVVLRIEGYDGLRYLTMQLPSGRKLFYAWPRLEYNEGREQLFYSGVDQTTKTWTRIPTYGGKLAENLTQAVARDCLTVTMTRIVAAGYRVVMHVHDEVVIEAPEGTELQPVLDIMAQPVPWAPGLILKGAGFSAGYYKKD